MDEEDRIQSFEIDGTKMEVRFVSFSIVMLGTLIHPDPFCVESKATVPDHRAARAGRIRF
jgi:hypothetical protein